MAIDQWYYRKDDETVGPVSEAELGRLIVARVIPRTAYVWSSALADWVPLNECNLLARMLETLPPLPPEESAAPSAEQVASLLKQEGKEHLIQGDIASFGPADLLDLVQHHELLPERARAAHERLAASFGQSREASLAKAIMGEGEPAKTGHNPEPPSEQMLKTWNWGAALLTWIWGLYHGRYMESAIAVLASLFIPFFGPIGVFVVFGLKGNAWAWERKKWKSVEDYLRVQRLWSLWAIWLTIIFIGLPILVLLVVYLNMGASMFQGGTHL